MPLPIARAVKSTNSFRPTARVHTQIEETTMSDLSTPAEDPQGDYIEAAIHALNANNPRAALRYLQRGIPAERVRYVVTFPNARDALGGESK